MEEELKKEYELAVLIDSEPAEAEIDKLLEFTDKEPARLITLAYPIKKHATAVFIVYRFSVLPEAISKLEGALRFHPHVLRSMIITPPIKKFAYQKRARETEVVHSSPLAVKEPQRSLSPEISSNELLTKTLEKLEQEQS